MDIGTLLSKMYDQNIYAVSRTTPEYVVIGPNWNLRLVIGQYKVSKGEGIVHDNMVVDRYSDLDR